MAKGAFWLFLEKGAQQISSFVVFAVIARMIGPEEYGLVALCGIVMMLMNNVTSGLVDAVISMRIRDDLRLSSLFWTVTGGGAVLSLLSFAAAQPFSALFGQEKLAPLLQAFSIVPFLFAIAAVPTALITAKMDFRVFTIRTFFAALVGGAVGIAAAMKGYGAFALAFQQIVSQIIINVVVWMGLKWRPRLMFSRDALGEMLKLGMGQTGSLFVSFFDAQTPRFVLGYFLGPAAVGYYSFVIRVCGAIQDGVIQPVLGVVYPALSEISGDLEKQKAILKQTIFLVGSVIFPIVVGIMMTAPLFVPLIFGQKWAAATGVLQLFSLTMISFSANIILRSILRAHRHITALLRAQTIIVMLAALAYFSVAWLGITAVIVTKVMGSFLAVATYTVLIKRKTKICLLNNYFSLWPPLLLAILMGAFLLIIDQTSLIAFSGWTKLTLIIFASGLIYSGGFLLLQKKMLLSSIALMRKNGSTNWIIKHHFWSRFFKDVVD